MKVLFTAPTAFRAIRRDDPDGDFVKKYDLSGFRALFLAGERADPETIKWAEHLLGVPGHRSLVADRDGLADGLQSGRSGPIAGQIRFPVRTDARL